MFGLTFVALTIDNVELIPSLLVPSIDKTFSVINGRTSKLVKTAPSQYPK